MNKRIALLFEKEVYKNEKKKGNVAGAFFLHNKETRKLKWQGKWGSMQREVMGAEY